MPVACRSVLWLARWVLMLSLPAAAPAGHQVSVHLTGAAPASGQPRPQDFVAWPDRPCLLRWGPGVEQRPEGDAAANTRGLPLNNGRCKHQITLGHQFRVRTRSSNGTAVAWAGAQAYSVCCCVNMCMVVLVLAFHEHIQVFTSRSFVTSYVRGASGVQCSSSPPVRV